MKKILIAFLFSLPSFALAQAVRLTVNEKIKDALVPISNTKFEITLNDTLKLELTSGSDGQLGKIPLENGVYKIVLSNAEFVDATENNVTVNASKTTAVTLTCTRKNGLKKEQKTSGK